MIHLLVADRRPLLRIGIAEVLRGAAGMSLVATAESATDLQGLLDVAPLDVAPLDVALLDLYLAGDAPAFDLVESAARNMRVLVMSAKEYPADAIGAIRAGARGCLETGASPATLLAAIQMVANGGFAFSAALPGVLDGQASGAGAVDRLALGGWRYLSLREREALHHIAHGLTHSQAASRMGVTKATIDTYVQRIKRKLGAGNKADLARLATARGVIITTGERPAEHRPHGELPVRPATRSPT